MPPFHIIANKIFSLLQAKKSQEAAMTTDIKISYINATANTDFDVVVFTKNYNVNTPKVYYVAWKVLRAQTEADFVFPVSMEVGATYTSSGTTNKAGPFPAELGSTWSIAQEPETATATLTQGTYFV